MKKKARTRGFLLCYLLSPLVLSAIGVAPAWAQLSYAEAQAGAVEDEDGPRPFFAAAAAQQNGPYAQQLAATVIAVGDVGGVLVGPEETWQWPGIRAEVFGWPLPPVWGNANANGWFESAGPFIIDIEEGAAAVVKASGYSGSANRLGIVVSDGGGVIYDVAVEWGYTPTGPYFQEVNTFGAWPAQWNIVQQTATTLVATIAPFQIPFPAPQGVARAEFYVDVDVDMLSIGQRGSLPSEGDSVSGSFQGRAEASGVDDANMASGVVRLAHLFQNRPNPFAPETQIAFELPQAGHVGLAIYSPDGRLVRQLLSEKREEGRHSATWDGRDEAGKKVASGTYFYQLRAPGVEESRRMILLP